MHSLRRYFNRIRRFSTMATLESLNFDNHALKTLPIDPEKENFVRQVPGACFSLVKPEPVQNPALVAYSKSAMELLDLTDEEMRRPDVAEYFSGNKQLPGSQTAAHCYCGHQFGHFSGQLGDGAAMYLGEVLNKNGERWEIQIKGAGPTPYSRHSDGRKVLRSTIREFLCSEAIHHLGIGTTRAGTCVTSDSTVVRDIFYSGNPINEQCSMVLRIAPTFFRFGSFEIFKQLADTGRKGPSAGNKELLIQMLDYSIKTFYTEIWDSHSSDKETMYYEFWAEVVRRTARLVADWMCVGWCHGVLNTDNMSIMGITIDYGPFGFLDRYQPDFICNNSDDGGRYSYQKQPEICKWNCKKLADALSMVLPLARTEPELHRIFDDAYQERYQQTMRKKFGLVKKQLPEDKDLVTSFLKTMEKTGADFTNSFRCLSRLPLPSSPDFQAKLGEVKNFLISQCCTAEELKAAYKPQIDPRQLQMFVQLMQTNPGILPALGSRFTVIAQELDRLEKLEALGDLTDESKREEDTAAWDSWLQQYTDRLLTPELQIRIDLTDESKREEDTAAWDSWLKQYTDRLKLEEEGQTDRDALAKERVTTMNNTNPRVILRNYIAQHAIDKAEGGDFSEVRRVLRLMENPYSDTVDLSDIQPSDIQPGTQQATSTDEDAGASIGSDAPSGSSACQRSHADIVYDERPPDWAMDLRVT